MPHSPYYISVIGEHMNLYSLSQCSHLSSTNLTHAGTELIGTQTGLPKTETHNVCLHGSRVYSEKGRVAVVQSWKRRRKTLSYEQERWQPVRYLIYIFRHLCATHLEQKFLHCGDPLPVVLSSPVDTVFLLLLTYQSSSSPHPGLGGTVQP